MNRTNARNAILLLALMVIGAHLYIGHFLLPAVWNKVVWLVLGGVLAASTALDLKDGSACLVYSTFQRSTDPVGYWTAIAITGVLGVGAALGALAGLVGLW